MGRETGRGLYELVLDHLQVGLSCLLCYTNSSLQWRRRLGHLGISKLRQDLPWISMSSFECESCQLSKHFRASYTHLDSIPSKSLFDLVHCNVWGPSRVASILVLRYYIVFVYDFSRASWVYLFKYRTDVLPSIHQFLQEISNQYSNTPKILGTDNALEFVQTALQDLCISHGILHQSTCPHTSQQNGVAERKHRHLLDMTLILLVEMGVPHFLWSDALHTYTYLLNGLPSSLLGGEVPFVVSTLIVTFLLCLLGCLVVWPSFMIILVIHSSWRPIMSKGCSSTTRAHKKAIGSIFQINASMLSLLMSHSSSLLPFSPPPPYLLPLQHHLHPLYLLGYEARKAFQIFVQDNDCSGRC